MTTLELAEAIARAVLEAVDHDQTALAPHHLYFGPSGDQSLAVDVLRVLHEHSSWFCRVVESETGPTIETPYEQVQQELFR